MEIEPDLSPYFGSQERSKGAELARKDLVVISSASDTDVRAFVKGSSACRVALTADEVAAPAFNSTCSCPQARKGDLCKHVWAVLLKLAEKGADFLEGKVEAVAPGAQSSAADKAREAKQEEYKTQQKQKAKDRNKEIRERKKREERGPALLIPRPYKMRWIFSRRTVARSTNWTWLPCLTRERFFPAFFIPTRAERTKRF